MRARMVLSALFKFRNIVILAASLILTNTLASSIPILLTVRGLMTPLSFVIYVISVIQTLSDKKFQEDYSRQEKLWKIRDLNRQANRLSSEARRNTTGAYGHKLRRMMDDKNEIFKSYSASEYSYLKERIVERTLNLVIVYIKLLNNYCIRTRELSRIDVSSVATRINDNSRKLNFARDERISDDLQKVIEMDQKLISRLKEEKKELERISTKLAYMESTVNMFKHQILASVENEEMLEQIETAVNEAEALENVLEERNREKLRR
jgi:hypothetical protein